MEIVHIILGVLFTMLNAIIGFFVARLYNQFDQLEARVRETEKSNTQVQTSLDYIQTSIDDIKEWIQNDRKK